MPSSSFDEYRDAIHILENTSKHPSLITKAIEEQILPKLSARRALLDVGAGGGGITRKFQHVFNEITAIDVNPTLVDAYAGTKIQFLTADFMQNDFGQKRYDLVLCSHVMYHLNKQDMTAFIAKLLTLVSPGGCCFIALMAPRGQNHRFHQEFNPSYVNSQLIVDILDEQQISYQRIASHNSFTTDRDASMHNLLRFFAVEDCQAKASAQLTDSENRHIEEIVAHQLALCRKQDGFELEQEEDYFVISRVGVGS